MKTWDKPKAAFLFVLLLICFTLEAQSASVCDNEVENVMLGIENPDDPSCLAAIQSYGKGEYRESFSVFYQLAQKGDVQAQTYIGNMLMNGQGTTQDFAEAVKWLFLAATNDFGLAQRSLAVAYMTGRGVDPDRGKAYFWSSIAASHSMGLDQFLFKDDYFSFDNTELRDHIIKDLSPEKIVALQNSAKEWIASNRKN